MTNLLSIKEQPIIRDFGSGTLLLGDCRDGLRWMKEQGIKVQMCVTSPPYWGLRDYGCDGQMGLEQSPEAYVQSMVEVFRLVRDVLADDGVIWVNLGDSYAGSGVRTKDHANPGISKSAFRDGPRNFRPGSGRADGKVDDRGQRNRNGNPCPANFKPKDLVGIPWRVAFALQADGWWLRSDIIWCLSGGTWLYVRTQKGDMPMMIKDIARLDPKTAKLWSGEKWTQVLGWSKRESGGSEIEIVLRSGERISCSPNHRFPTADGLKEARDIKLGDILVRTQLPQPDSAMCPEHISLDLGWFVGLYIAEGSRSGDCIQISGHANEKDRWFRVKQIADDYGCNATCSENGNSQNIRVYGKILNAVIDHFVSGRTAKDKCLSPVCWRYEDIFLQQILAGYLSGDGHYDKQNDRWRLGFTRNYNLERDIRTLAARLGLHLVLNFSTAKYQGGERKAFRGELRYNRNGHWNERKPEEVVEIRKARCRYVYDIGVADEPHTFALASGIITHNSKPSCMPESVTDRPTRSHEYVFLLAKSQKYFYDNEAIKEPSAYPDDDRRDAHSFSRHKRTDDANYIREGKRAYPLRNKRSVWSVSNTGYSEAHFATFPPDLIKPCILAGSRPGDTILDPFMGSGTTAMVAESLGRKWCGCELNSDYVRLIENRLRQPNMIGGMV